MLEFARAVNGTQIVVGASRHGRFAQLVRPSTSMAIVRDSGDIDVYVVTHERAVRAGGGGPPARRPPSGVTAWIAAVAVPAVLAAALLPWRDTFTLSTVLLVFLLGVLANALIGGVLPAALGALIAGLLANFLFTPPFGSLTIAQPANIFALVVFVVVGVTVASIVDRSRRRARDAARGRTEAQLLAAVATRSASAEDPVRDRARAGPGRVQHALRGTRDSAGPVGGAPEVTACAGAPVTGASARRRGRGGAVG